MYFVTKKEKDIMMKISYWTKVLKDYVNKEKPSGKIESKLITLIEENKEDIRKMDTYSDKEIQTKKEESNVKSLQDFLHDNSSTNNLYLPDHWGLVWDTEGENLVSEENIFDLEDLYVCRNYDNVLYSEYEDWLSEEEVGPHYQNRM